VFSKRHLRFACTPDWDTAGVICIQLATHDGIDLTGWDVRYGDKLTVRRVIELVEPYLRKADEYEQ
jgi:hypothetical protein